MCAAEQPVVTAHIVVQQSGSDAQRRRRVQRGDTGRRETGSAYAIDHVDYVAAALVELVGPPGVVNNSCNTA